MREPPKGHGETTVAKASDLLGLEGGVLWRDIAGQEQAHLPSREVVCKASK